MRHGDSFHQLETGKILLHARKYIYEFKSHLGMLLLFQGIQGTVYRIPFTEYRLQNTVYRIPFTGYRLQNTVYRTPFTEYRLQGTVYRIPFTEYRLQNTVENQTYNSLDKDVTLRQSL